MRGGNHHPDGGAESHLAWVDDCFDHMKMLVFLNMRQRTRRK
jgi:hypothetical protein